jgi:hypothetical protein
VQQIPNVQTTADYTNATTLGPDAFESVTVNVWNFSALMQVFTQPEGGYQVGEWADEILCTPGQYTLDRCAGVRFKTNTATPTTPARILAQAWRDGEPRVFGGLEYTTTLGGTGAVTTSQMITGRVNGVAGTIVAGSGFTLTVNGVGDYTITFTTPFAAAPAPPQPLQLTANRAFCQGISVTASAVRYAFFNSAGAALDVEFIFVVEGMV